MKNKIGISKKLFIITTIVFGIFISSGLILQSLFFERFYLNKKEKELISTVEKLAANYNKLASVEDRNNLIKEYEDNYNIKIGILDAGGSINFTSKTSSNRLDLIKIRELNEFASKWRKGDDRGGFYKKGIETTIIENEQFAIRYLIGTLENKDMEEVIFALSSLQPVNEATLAISEFYRYFYIASIVCIIILSLVYSNMITKPLLKINDSATKMAKLDFSEKCEVKSSDEIGNVAASLNFLSLNLCDALNSLKEANTKLAEDIQKERKLEKMRKEFVTSVSHELKTPITLIEGYAIGLKDDIFDGVDKHYYLDIIIDEAKKMGNLVSDMLDLSQLESGTFKLSKEYFSLNELIKMILKRFEGIIGSKSIKVETELLESDSTIFADWRRMEQVITNFITNALRYVPKEGAIFVRTIDQDNFLQVEVENTGSRIPDSELQKVWDKFYRIDKSRSRKLGGTGIGLSIVKNILILHKYDYGVVNTAKGVQFYFKIPKES